MLENLTSKAQLTDTSLSGDKILRDRSFNERIAQKAYDLYLKRGKVDGHDIQDWLEAEKLVLGDMGSKGFMGEWLQTLCGWRDGEKNGPDSSQQESV